VKLSVLLSLLLVASACSPEEDPPNYPTGDSPSGGDPGGGGDSDFRPDTCQIDSFITQVTGTVTDESGNGLENARPQLCVRVSGTGDLTCLSPPATDSVGAFEINVPTPAQCMRQAVMRVILPGADRSTSYCVVDLPTDRSTVAIAEPFILHPTTPAGTLPAREPADQARTVVLGDVEIDVVPERFYSSGAGYDGLAATRLASDADGLCLPDDLTLDSVFAFSPEGDVTGDPFPVRIANTGSYAANAEVNIYFLGGVNCTVAGNHVAEGEWVLASTATVDSGGTAIEGGTIPCITWIGVALRP
jgi:hypothetical protein